MSALERFEFLKKRLGYTCQCYACKMKLPKDPTSYALGTELTMKMFPSIFMENNTSNFNILFKESLQKFLNKNVNLGTRMLIVENLYQLMFMNHQLSYEPLFKNIEKRSNEILNGVF